MRARPYHNERKNMESWMFVLGYFIAAGFVVKFFWDAGKFLE